LGLFSGNVERRKYNNRVCPRCDSPLTSVVDTAYITDSIAEVDIGIGFLEKNRQKIKAGFIVQLFGYQCSENHIFADRISLKYIALSCPNPKCNSFLIPWPHDGKMGLICFRHGNGCYVKIKKMPQIPTKLRSKIEEKILERDWDMSFFTRSSYYNWYKLITDLKTITLAYNAMIPQNDYEYYNTEKVEQRSQGGDIYEDAMMSFASESNNEYDQGYSENEDRGLQLSEYPEYINGNEWRKHTGTTPDQQNVSEQSGSVLGHNEFIIDQEEKNIDQDRTIEIDRSNLDLSKKYEKIKKIGVGGFAEVYTVKDKKGDLFAMKTPHLDVIGKKEEKALRTFTRECQNWSELVAHEEFKDGIVEVIEYGTEPSSYIVMEYMEGGSLRDNLKTMSFDEKVECLLSLFRTFHKVHHYGVIHRDIKPENILKDGWGQWKIADWGLSKVLLKSEGTTTVTGTIKATLAYASPEQVDPNEFGKVDWRTDIYQLGAMAYEMFTGRKPFEGSPTGIMFSIVSKEPRPPNEIEGSIPKDISDMIMKAMSKDKEERWQGTHDMYRILKGVGIGIPK